MAHNSDSESDEMAYSAFVTDNHDCGPPSNTVYLVHLEPALPSTLLHHSDETGAILTFLVWGGD
jgi:hypothetical protein